VRHIALAIAVAALAGCGKERPAAPAASPAWRLEPVMTLAGPPDTGWTRLKDVVADAAGNVYVLDEGAAQIRVFDSAGAPLRIIGRKGAGPGEFGEAYGMGIGWLGDTLAVLDPANARLGRLTPEGTWIGSWPVKRITGSAVRLHQATISAVYAPDWRPLGDKAQSLLVRYAAAGPGDTLVLPERLPDPPGAIVCPSPGGAIRFFAVPFAPGIVSEPAPGGELATARTDGYRVAFVSPRGDTVRTVGRSVEPVSVSDSEWTAGVREYEEFRSKNPGANCDPSSPPRVRVKPIIRALFFDDAGRLWVERRSAGGDLLDVFDPAGKLLGTMPAPAHDEDIPLYVRGNRLHAVQVDAETGAQGIRVYRVIRPAV